MPIYSPYVLPQQREKNSRYRLLVLAWIIVTILSIMYLGRSIASWRDTNRAWAQEGSVALPIRNNLKIESF
jgi:hypothetical protein